MVAVHGGVELVVSAHDNLERVVAAHDAVKLVAAHDIELAYDTYQRACGGCIWQSRT